MGKFTRGKLYNFSFLYLPAILSKVKQTKYFSVKLQKKKSKLGYLYFLSKINQINIRSFGNGIKFPKV